MPNQESATAHQHLPEEIARPDLSGTGVRSIHELQQLWEQRLGDAAADDGGFAGRVLRAWNARPGRISSDFLETGMVQMIKGWLDIADGYAAQTGSNINSDPDAGGEWGRMGTHLKALMRQLDFQDLGGGQTPGSQPVEELIDDALTFEGRQPDGGATLGNYAVDEQVELEVDLDE